MLSRADTYTHTHAYIDIADKNNFKKPIAFICDIIINVPLIIDTMFLYVLLYTISK